MLVKDSHNYVFGGFCAEEWTEKSEFFGNGQNFIFTYKDTENIETWSRNEKLGEESSDRY